MSLPIEAAVPLFTLGWAAGVGTALACRPARSARARRELLVDPRGWRIYAPVSRPGHANSDNGAPTTARLPIEPQGPARVKPEFPPPRKIREGFTAEEIQADNLRSLSELKAWWLANQANVARIEAEQDSIRAVSRAQARRSDIWQPQANKAVQQLADEVDRDSAEAVINDASRLWMRHDMGQPPSRPQVQVREPYSPSHVAECGGPCERIGICDCGNPPNLPAPGKPLHPAPQANS